MQRTIVDRIRAQGESYCRIQNETGERVWEVTRTNLLGSFDSRIMVKPMYEDCIKSKSGKPEWHPCTPYLVIECSIAKILNGHNVYGGLNDLSDASKRLRDLLQHLLGVPLPDTKHWTVQRVDWAENFHLSYQAVQEFFEGIHHIAFPRRKMQKYGNEAVFIPGTTTTIKLYHKGPEFGKHDRKRLYVVMRSLYQQNRPRHAPEQWAQSQASRKVAALQRLANNRLRAEVEIHAEKLDYDFGHRPKVHEVSAAYLHEVFDKEISRLLREGKDATQIVRTSLAVRDRLEAHYSPELAGLLHGFWFNLATHGEEDTRKRNSRPTFYRRRKQLVDAGVSWLTTDVQLIERQGQLLPVDFSPVRANPRRCCVPVRERPALSYERGLLQLAA
ncbi:phage/plasmid replication protein, II/X family [Hylemonella sp. W303a]|uniref:phage/plasmid replication protein, II/X family n=1 Tax=Hylemonella sp. W303a TaxID=3389873 RepID=UPI00396B060E